MKKYYLADDLLFKRFRLSLKHKFIRVILFFLISLFLGAVYNFSYYKINGSKEEEILHQKINELEFRYALLDKQFNQTLHETIKIQRSKENYSDILEFVEPDFSYNQNEEEYEYFKNFPRADIIIPAYKKLDTLSYLVEKYTTDYYYLQEKAVMREDMYEHLPYISPVNISIRRGDGIKFRERHPILGIPAWHHGQDFSAPMRTPIHATGAGKIIYVGFDRGLGNFIKIDHGYGYQTIYGHLSQFKVKRGQEVKRGDIIGLSGSTGYSTGPHLHYEIHLYGQYQNPLHFFNDDLSEDEYIEMINTLNSRF